MKYLVSLLILLSAWAVPIQAALVPGDDDLYIRVVDVGAGLCTITHAPGPRFMVYDAGHWNNHKCHDAAKEIIDDNDIDLLVISHNDGDHLGDADLILSTFRVKKIIRTGFERRGTRSWEDMNRAIGRETEVGATVINLGTEPLVPGAQMNLGSAQILAVRGYNRWPHDEGSLSVAELRNVISIVLRLTYRGKSVLFTGDTVGRDMDIQDDDQCKYAEKLMVDNAAVVPIDAGVIIAPHHGSETSGSRCFLNAVNPEFAVFSAGHAHKHPRDGAMNRYLGVGLGAAKVFRTDRGDDEGAKESALQRVDKCEDKSGDDDVEIVIRNNGTVEVDYRLAPVPCSD